MSENTENSIKCSNGFANKAPKHVQRRLLIPLTAIMLLMISGFMVVLVSRYQSNLNQSCQKILEDASTHMTESLAEQSLSLKAIEETLLSDADMINAIKVQDRDQLLADYRPIFSKLQADHGITHFYFHLPNRVNLLRVHKPEKYGDLIERFTALEAERTKQTASGIELGPLGTFTLRVVKPVFDSGNLIGYLEMGKEIEDILVGIHDVHGVQIAITINKKELDRSKWESGMKMLGRKGDWNRFPNNVLIYNSLGELPHTWDMYVEEMGHAQSKEDTLEFNGDSWRVVVYAIKDASGIEVGNMIILEDISQVQAAFYNLLFVSLGAALLLMIGSIGFLYILLRRTDLFILEQQMNLTNSEEKYEILYESSEDAIVLTNPRTGKFIGGNPSAIKMFGVKDENEFIKMGPADTAPQYQPDGRLSSEKTSEIIARAMKEGSFFFEWTQKRLDGTEFMSNVLLSKVQVGNEIFLQATVRDITKEKAAQKQLEESNLQLDAQRQQLLATNQQYESEATYRKQAEERLTLALKASNTGLWDLEIKTGKTYFSPTYYTMLGYEPDEFPATYDSWRNLMHPDDFEATRDNLEGYLSNGKSYRQEFRIKGKDGNWRWIYASGDIVERDENNEPKRITGTHTDITDRKRAEEEVNRSFQRFQILVDSLDTLVYIADFDSHELIYMNKYGRDLWGDCKGKTCWQVLQSDLSGPCEFCTNDKLLDAQGNSTGVHHWEFKNTANDRWYDCRDQAIRWSDGHYVRMEIAIDITERKKAEKELLAAKEEAEDVNELLMVSTAKANDLAAQAEWANMAKTQFLANMSHEIRTPMNSIIGFSDILFQEDLSEEHKEYVDHIRNSGSHLLGLINNILDYSKIEAGKVELEMADCPLDEILGKVKTMMQPLAMKENLSFEINLEDGLPVNICTDSTRLMQCLINLVNNAVKFTEAGHVYLNVFAENKNDQSFINFAVEDTGIGIPKDKQASIFESFTQAEKNTNRKYGGTGLGLAITKQLGNLFGGDLVLSSEYGKGSVFTLTIPVGVDVSEKSDFQEQNMSTEGDADTNEKAVFSGRVLVADDEVTNQMLMKVLLEKNGLDVEIVEDGKGAVEKATSESFDLIFMDMQMPNMNGYEAASLLKKQGITTPIIALTANAMKGDDKKCFEAGCDEYLVKPIDHRELLKRIGKYLPVMKYIHHF